MTEARTKSSSKRAENDFPLEVNSCSKKFGGVTALAGVSLHVDIAQVCALIGPNGAGKTTLFDIISGVTSPTEGSVSLHGEDITGRSPTWRARHGIRRTFQRQQPFGWLSVEDNLLVALEWPRERRVRDHGRLHRQRLVEVNELIDLLSLGSVRGVLGAHLTIGQARLLEIGRAIINPPDLLLLDEPTSGLAAEEVTQIGLAIGHVRGSTAVLLVEHNIPFVIKEASFVYVLNRGSVLAQGTPAEIRANPDVSVAYLGGT